MTTNAQQGPPLAALNLIRKRIDDAHAVAAAAAAASHKNDTRLTKAAVAFSSMRDEVAALALDLAELRREIHYAQRDALVDRLRAADASLDPWDADDAADAQRRQEVA